MRIIIYALGKVFKAYKEKIDWNQVIALSDKKAKEFHNIFDKPVILPEVIKDFCYDFVAVFTSSDCLFEEIKMELTGKYFVPKDKIISWKEIIIDENIETSDILRFYQNFLKERKCSKVLDFGMSIISRNCLTKEELISEDNGVLDGVWGNKALGNDNLYDNIFMKYSDCTEQYDVILLGEDLLYTRDEWDYIKQQTIYILIHSRYFRNGNFVKITMKDQLQRFGKVICVAGIDGLFWIVDTRNAKSFSDISVYVVTHRNYNLYLDDFYKPLCVGGYQKKGYLTEQIGDNIAYLNRKINECTALYWIWKNTNTKYVGLNHYRRYFYRDGIESIDNYLDAERAIEIFETHDIILPKTYPLTKVKVIDQIKTSIDKKLCEKVNGLFRNKIQKTQPDYLQSYDDVMNGYNAFLCNMFVTKREIMNSYCEWLFSFLIEIADEIDIENYDKYSQRAVGFFAERMWTVWLRKNKLKIKELPYVIVK